jgi:asparagine synthetase B (glutamine-hydrolysing)
MPDASCLAGVHAVPPGSWIELGADGERAKRYQKLSIDIAERSDEAHAEALRQRLLQAARRQTRRFEVIGVALSGGLDFLGRGGSGAPGGARQAPAHLHHRL